MTIHEIVKKLVGTIRPAGDSTIDPGRFENLKAMTELVTLLVEDIDDVAFENKNSHEFSVKQAGEFAHKFLTDDLGIGD